MIETLLIILLILVIIVLGFYLIGWTMVAISVFIGILAAVIYEFQRRNKKQEKGNQKRKEIKDIEK